MTASFAFRHCVPESDRSAQPRTARHGSIVGSVLGAITLTALPEYFRQFPGMDELFFGAVIVMVLLFLPKGLISLLCRISPLFNERYYRD